MNVLATQQIENTYQKPDLATAYFFIKDAVLKAGFGEEISWQASVKFENITESDFLSEYAWVALSAGMKERVIRKRFQYVSYAFFHWESAKIIATNEDSCRRLALRYFNNRRKIEAIISTARDIASLGFSCFKEAIYSNPLEVLQALPFIGPVTRYHLAKNIGLPFAKPDRHLVRLATYAGYGDVQEFCGDICMYTGDSIPVVDLVLWRFAVTTESYLKVFHQVAYR